MTNEPSITTAQRGAGTADDRSAAQHVADTGTSEAAKVGQEVKSQASNLVHQAGDTARERADSQLGQLAGTLDKMGDELRRMSEGASDSDNILAALASDGAAAAKRMSSRLDSDGLDGAMSEIRSFARRRPTVFLAGAFAVGIAAGRLTRNADLGRISSNAQHHDDGISADPYPTGTVVAPGGMPRTTGSTLPTSPSEPGR